MGGASVNVRVVKSFRPLPSREVTVATGSAARPCSALTWLTAPAKSAQVSATVPSKSNINNDLPI